MKRKSKLIVFFILLIITTLLTGKSVFADSLSETERDGEGMSDFDHVSDSGEYSNFCINTAYYDTWDTNSARTEHKYGTLMKNTTNRFHQTSSVDGEISPQVGYALWYLQKTGQLGAAYSSEEDNELRAQLQYIIYNSEAIYGDTSICELGSAIEYPGEVQKWSKIYATCYYEIFNQLNGQSLFTAYSFEDELAVNVDQEAKTIVVGPYYLDLNTNASSEAKGYLYNQLIRDGVDDNTAFATYTGIKNMNCIEGTEPIFINQSGEEIKFPNFLTYEPFYIKFQVGNDGSIIEVAKRVEEYKKKPTITAQYINGFTGNVSKYQANTYEFEELWIHPNGADVSILRKNHVANDAYEVLEVGDGWAKIKAWFSVDVSVKFTSYCYAYNEVVGGRVVTSRYFTLEPEVGKWPGYAYTCTQSIATEEDYEDIEDDEGNIRREYKGTYHIKNKKDIHFSGGLYKELDGAYGGIDCNKGPYTLEVGGDGFIQQRAIVTLNEGLGCLPGTGICLPVENDGGASIVEDRTYAENKEINMVIQGTVWKDMPSETKQYVVDGKNDRVGNGVQQTTAGLDIVFPGVQVDLYELENKNSTSAKLIATTTTDTNGKYYFYGKKNAEEPLINPLKKYFVVFTYNGQLYQATYYKNDLSKGTNDGYSNAKEAIDSADFSMETTRATINARFSTIDPSGNNYNSPSKGGANSAYAYTAEIKDENGNLTGKQFRDVWAEFIKASTFKGSAVQDPVKEDYDKIWDRQQSYENAYSSLDTLDSVKTFIKDCMITAKSYQMGDDTSLYPVYDQFQIESVDQTSKKYQGVATRIDYNAIPAGAWTYTTYKSGQTGTNNNMSHSMSHSMSSTDWKSAIGAGLAPADVINFLPRTSAVTATGTYTTKVWNGSAGNISDYVVTYPKDYDVIGITYHYLYTVKSAQCYYANFGMTWREEPEMSIQKDVYQAKVIVNGKEHTYTYNKTGDSKDPDADDGVWKVSLKAGNALYNASFAQQKKQTYIRDIYKSDYIYTGTGDEAIKNLQIIVTYRITLKNTGNVSMKVNELVDYYDYDNYQYDASIGTDPNSTGDLGSREYKTYSYSDGNGETASTPAPSSYTGTNTQGARASDNKLKVYGSSQTSKNSGYGNSYETETLTGGNFNYHAIYLTGIVNKSGNEWFAPGEKGYVYVTFRVKTDENGKVKLDQNTQNVTDTTSYMASYESRPGKRNIIEINSYSTKYVDAATVPDTLDSSNGMHDRAVGGKEAGLIDKSSNPGNLATSDLTSEGYLDYTETESNYTDEFRRR